MVNMFEMKRSHQHSLPVFVVKSFTLSILSITTTKMESCAKVQQKYNFMTSSTFSIPKFNGPSHLKIYINTYVKSYLTTYLAYGPSKLSFCTFLFQGFLFYVSDYSLQISLLCVLSSDILFSLTL
jgi:hypothetical protein